MASLKDTVKAALSPKAATHPRVQNRQQHEAEVMAAFDAMLAARKTVEDLQGKFTTANLALDKAEGERDQAALAAETGDAGAVKAYEKASEVVEQRKADRARITAAQKAAGEALIAAELALRQTTHSDKAKVQSRIGSQMLKVAAEAETAVQALYVANCKLAELQEKRRLSWPNGSPPMHGFMHEGELQRALANYFYKVSGRPFIGGSYNRDIRAPELPGSRPTIVINQSQEDIPSLCEVIEAANKFLLEEVNKLPLPSLNDASREFEPDVVVPAPVAASATVGPVKPAKPVSYDARSYVPPKTSVMLPKI